MTSLAGRPLALLRGTILNRTYATHKNLNNYLFLLTKFGPIYYGPPLYEADVKYAGGTAV